MPAAATSAAGSAGSAGERPVVVIGAGPVGLAAAAHLQDYGLPALVLEAGTEVGAAIRDSGISAVG